MYIRGECSHNRSKTFEYGFWKSIIYVVAWDIKLPMHMVIMWSELSCDITRMRRGFIYLVMSRPFSGPQTLMKKLLL